MSSNMNLNVSVIGLGLMGLSIAKNIAKAGFRLKAYDINKDVARTLQGLGAILVDTPGDAGTDADVVMLSLPGPAEVESVCLGTSSLIETMKAGSVIVDLSTNGVDTVRKLQSIFAEKGIGFLDGPVSGGPWGAADGTLAIWVGGEKSDYEKALPALRAVGRAIDYMGPTGTGTITKLVHNTGANIRHSMLSEIMNLGVKAGIDPVALFKAIREGSNGLQRTFDGIAGKYLDGTYDEPAFRLKHAHKDLRLSLELGNQLGLQMDLAQAVMRRMDEAMAKGWGDRDSSAVGLIAQDAAGIKIEPRDKVFLKEIISES